MSRKARTWAAAAAFIVLVAGGALAYGQASGTFAIFSAETKNPNAVFKGSWIPAPSATSSALPAASPWQQVSLSWTSGASAGTPSPNPVTGQTILYADGGTGASASCGAYTSFSSLAAATTSASVTGTNIADWWCFEVQSISAGAWTSGVVTFTPRRIFVPITVSLNNGTGTAGALDNGDTIVITYNQARANLGTVNVGTCTNGSIRISTAAISCAAAPTIGIVTGLALSKSRTCNTSGTAGNGTATVTITLANCSGASTVSGAGTFTATGTGVTSSGGQNACTTNPTCSVAASGDL